MSSGFLGGLFGKKDKNPQQPPAPPAPKPIPAPAPASKLQPGLSPVPARTNIGAATTQPMVLPKSGGLKPAKPALISGGKSTQRIVLPGRGGDASAPQANVPSGNLSLPLGMIVRLLPDSVRAISLAEFEALPEADQDVSLPLGLILPQLPSGKVEVSVQELVAAIPRTYVRSQEEIAPFLSTLVSMPLMDVVMRIPPDMLALRPDQKEVDAAVVNMADPFTEELLREQAEAARKAEAEKQAAASAPAPAAPAPAAPVTPVVPPAPVASQALPEGMPTIPLPRPVANKPPVTPMVPPPAPFKSASGPRPPSITLPRPGARPPTPGAPVAATPVPPPPAPAPIVPPPAPEPTAEASATEGGLTEEMKKLLAAAEAELGEGDKSEAPATPAVPEPIEEKAAAPVIPPVPPAPVVPEPEPEPVTVPEPVAVTPPPPIPAPMPPPPPMAIKPPPAPAPIAPPPPAPVAPRSVTPPPPPPLAPKPAVLPPPPAPMAVPPPPAPAPIAATPVVEEKPAPAPIPVPEPEPVVVPPAPPAPAPVAVEAPSVPATSASAPTPTPAAPKVAPRSVDLNGCTVDQLAASGCPRLLAEAIVKYRASEGPFRRLEDLLKVPGLTKAAYALLTGKEVSTEDLLGTVNEVLGFPADQEVGLKDITDRISQWPDVTGCVLGQASGLPLVGKVPAGLEKSAVMAFVPRLLTELNTSFKEFSGRETNELSIPTKGTSYHIFRNDKLYLVILSRRRQLPRRYTKVARYVLSSIDASRHQ